MEIHAQICSIHPSKKPFFFSCEFILQRRHRQGLRLMWLYLLKGLCITAREQLTAKWKNNQGGQGSRISVNHPTVNNILVYPELLRLMREGRTTLQGADPGTARDLGAASQPGIYTFVCVRVCVCVCVMTGPVSWQCGGSWGGRAWWRIQGCHWGKYFSESNYSHFCTYLMPQVLPLNPKSVVLVVL